MKQTAATLLLTLLLFLAKASGDYMSDAVSYDEGRHFDPPEEYNVTPRDTPAPTAAPYRKAAPTALPSLKPTTTPTDTPSISPTKGKSLPAVDAPGSGGSTENGVTANGGGIGPGTYGAIAAGAVALIVSVFFLRRRQRQASQAADAGTNTEMSGSVQQV